ncbi:MAG TPA: ABC transporter permease [Dinghuibacter sp.]|uniref:ABC transporter permease n=1 Tax=Dinghuibacter sp. TaxID=2024697 RepID=UPI002D154B40|nr:ABC transporter permease [Dinghuibacter sp.]HTJ14286.1 ABC transporter permease [Dinghuibacter sp.]
MFATNLRIALRNLWKYRGFSLVNVLGLSISLAGCILIMLYVFYERSYDHWNPRAANVYRLLRVDPNGDIGASMVGELAPILKDRLPEITDYSRFHYWEMGKRLVVNGDKSVYVDHVQGVDSTFFRLFPYTLIEGDTASALKETNMVVISDLVAKKLFGDKPAIGKVIYWQAKNPVIVSGVFRTPSTPTHFQADIVHKLNSKGDGWFNWNFYSYIAVRPGTDIKRLESRISQEVNRLPEMKDDNASAAKQRFKLIPLTDLYFRTDIHNDFVLHGDAKMLRLLIGIALLLLVIACINFTNFNITQSIRRSRETGMRKVLGAQRYSLALYYLLETTLQVLVGLVLGLVIAELFLPSLGSLLGVKLHLFDGGAWKNLWVALAIGVLVIGASGGFVAYHISGLEPVRVMKGEYQGKGRGAMIRKMLLIVQFAFAALAVGSLLVIHHQEQYMERLDPGFHKEQVIVAEVHTSVAQHWEETKNRLSSLPGVRIVSKVNYLPGDKEMQVIGSDVQGEHVDGLDVVTVGYDYFEAMGMQLKKGRFFNSSYGLDSNSLILNETALRHYKTPVLGHPWLNKMTIVGIVGDINQRGFERAAEPTVYQIESDNTNPCTHVILKVDGTNLPLTIKQLTAAWKEIEPGFPLEYHFLDEQFNRMYQKYREMDTLFTAFSSLTLLIALLGIFVLSAFIALQRTKEIGIRKVLGASVNGVITLLSRDFLILVLVANAIALPVIWVLGRQWLQSFAYQDGMPWYAFAGTVALTLLCTLVTVSIQAWKAAVADPVKALKYE